LGLEEGKQFVFHVRDGKGDLRALEAAARSLEGEKIDLIVAVTTSVTLAVKRATRSVPIVFYTGTDPVSVGLVESFRKPGGRLTGIHGQATGLTAKRLELLKEMIPRLRRVVTFYRPESPAAQQAMKTAREAAGQLKVELLERPVASVEELRTGLRALRPGEADALFYVADAMVASQAELLVESARAKRLLTMFQERWSVTQGGAGRLWRELLHDRPALRQARPARAAGRQPRRAAGRAGRPLPLRRQPQDREGPRPHHPAGFARPGG
jgi:putative ABC transport system substrate-binding protein